MALTILTIAPGQEINKDTDDWKVMAFSWDAHLNDGVQLTDRGTFTVAAANATARNGATPLAVDVWSLEEGNRSVLFRIIGGTSGGRYNVAHLIATDETPQQKRERSFFVNVKEL